MTSNTVGYKTNEGDVGTSMVDSNKEVVSKKYILPINHSTISVASPIEKENSMEGRNGKSTKLGEED